MPCIRYTAKNFQNKTLEMITQANQIISEYRSQGYVLTLRQLYYQFVARDLIANKQSEYKRLGGVVNDARLAGMIDWSAIEDRTRSLEKLSAWSSPGEIIESAAASYHLSRWQDQRFYVEVWIEKEALAGVFERICNRWDVPFFCCRGYPSQSEVWAAAQRLIRTGKPVKILHFGDHDPSGLDMTRDIRERLELFRVWDLEVRRLALNMDQIDEYDPPPNPAKDTDSRFTGYSDQYGDESWELDALEPSVLSDLVGDAVAEIVDMEKFEAVEEREETERNLLSAAADNWERVVTYLDQYGAL